MEDTSKLPDIILYDADKNRIITYANEQFYEISGLTKKELIGKPYDYINRVSENSQVEQMWKELSQGKIWKGRISNKLKDNKKQIIDDIKNYENSSCHLKNRIETLLNNKNVSRDEVLKNKILNFKNDYKKEFKYLQNIILETSKYPNNYNSESLNCIQNEMKQEVKESSTKKE